MLKIEFHRQFQRDLKKASKRGLDEKLLKDLIVHLASGKQLPAKYKDHQLMDSRKYKKMRECHIQPDWLLVYYINREKLTLILVRNGSHSDIFD